MRVSVTVNTHGQGGDSATETYAGWTASACVVPGDGATVTLSHARHMQQPQTFAAYVLAGKWMCHALGRSDVPTTGKQVARRALRRLPIERG